MVCLYRKHMKNKTRWSTAATNCFLWFTFSTTFTPQWKQQVLEDHHLRNGHVNLRKRQITTYRVGKIMQNTKPPWWTKLKTWKENMFEILEKVVSFCICHRFSQLANIFFGSSFKVMHLDGRKRLFCLYTKCSHKNCLYSYAGRAQSTMAFMRPIAANQGSDKKHPIYFSRITVHSCIFK